MKTKLLLACAVITANIAAAQVGWAPFNETGDPNATLFTCEGQIGLRLDDGDATSIGEATSVWSNTHQVDLAHSFEMRFAIRFEDTVEADGITFTLHRDQGGLQALGGTGGYLGVSDDYNSGLDPAVSVEFDIWNNAAVNGDSTPHNHIAISYDGDLNSPVFGPELIDLDNNTWHDVVVRWDACDAHLLTVTLDGQLVAELNADLVNDVFQGNSTGVFFGFTAATHNNNTIHEVCFESYQEIPCNCDGVLQADMLPFSPLCVGNCCIGMQLHHNSTVLPVSVIYDWGDGTTSTDNVHQYAQGGIYVVRAIMMYHLINDPYSCCIKVAEQEVIMDCRAFEEPFGKGGLTPTKSGKLFPNPVQEGGQVTIEIPNEETNGVLEVISLSGQSVARIPFTGAGQITIDLPETVTAGMYIIKSNDIALEPIRFQVVKH